MNIVMIPFHDWKKCEREGFRTRDAHFMEEFGRHPLVDKLLILNRPTSLPEITLLRKNWHVLRGTTLKETNDIRISQVDHKTFTLDLRVWDTVEPIIHRRNWIPKAYAKNKYVESIHVALEYLEIAKDYALFISAPLFAPLVGKLAPAVLWFDAQDNLLKHALYRNVPHLSSYYDQCLDMADFVSANSTETTEWLSQKDSAAIHIGNGVSAEFFDPQKSYPIPADMLPISRPIVGYAGKMQEMFDVPLMMMVAESLPEVNFVFIGQQLNSKWMQPLWNYSNVFYLGDKPYSLLPDYLSAFDICIIPYRINMQHGGDPIKFYEYLAMQKPIVTTDIGEVGRFREFSRVWVSSNADTFIQDLLSALSELRELQVTPISQLPSNVLWSNKVDQIIQQIHTKLKGRLPNESTDLHSFPD
ncbi:MAG: glycosyltransferase [Caldilineaceae bacterium]